MFLFIFGKVIFIGFSRQARILNLVLVGVALSQIANDFEVSN